MRRMLAALLLPTLAASTGFAAETETPVTNDIHLHILYSSKDSIRTHRYHDLENSGFLLDTSFNYAAEAATGSWQIEAKNLGLSTRELYFDLEMPRDITLKLNYQESVFNEDHSGRTPYAGTTQLDLPTNWQSGVATNSFDPGSFHQDTLLGVHRRSLEAIAEHDFTNELSSALSLSLENRAGKRLQGTAIYFNAANPQAVLLPITIDEDSTRIEWQTRYNGDDVNGFFTYRLTEFNNQISSTRWQNPYASGLGPSIDYPAGTAEIDGDPGYRQHFARLGAAYRLSNTVRLAFDATASSTQQTEKLLPYTANEQLTVIQPTPIDRFDQPLNTGTINLIAYLQPLPSLGFNVRYQYDQRDNTGSRHPWRYIPGDGTNQPAAQFAVFNKPLKFEKERLTLTSNLRLPNRQRLELTYGIERVFRNYAAVEDTEESHFGVAYRFTTGARWQHRLGVDYRNKAGSTYEWARSFYQLLSAPLINQIPDDQRWINHPSLRQFHLANRQKLEAHYRGNFQFNAVWQLQLNLNREITTFDKSDLGLRDDNGGGGNLALTWYPNPVFDFSAYADYRSQSRTQSGRDFTGGIQKPANRVTAPLTQGSDPARNYDLLESNKVLSMGLDVAWDQSERLRFAGHYAMNLASSDLSYDTLLPASRLPALETTVHSLEAGATWRYSARLEFSGSYAYYRYEDIDYAFPSSQIGFLDKVLTTSPQAPNEAVSSLTFSIAYNF